VEKLYRIGVEIPEIGALPGDYLVVRPGHPEPLSVVRKLPGFMLPHLLPYLEELTPIQPPPWERVEGRAAAQGSRFPREGDHRRLRVVK
jgi:hypothetical protein